jgi:hypothetical protein
MNHEGCSDQVWSLKLADSSPERDTPYHKTADTARPNKRDLSETHLQY